MQCEISCLTACLDLEAGTYSPLGLTGRTMQPQAEKGARADGLGGNGQTDLTPKRRFRDVGLELLEREAANQKRKTKLYEFGWFFSGRGGGSSPGVREESLSAVS